MLGGNLRSTATGGSASDRAMPTAAQACLRTVHDPTRVRFVPHTTQVPQPQESLDPSAHLPGHRGLLSWRQKPQVARWTSLNGSETEFAVSPKECYRSVNATQLVRWRAKRGGRHAMCSRKHYISGRPLEKWLCPCSATVFEPTRWPIRHLLPGKGKKSVQVFSNKKLAFISGNHFDGACNGRTSMATPYIRGPGMVCSTTAPCG